MLKLSAWVLGAAALSGVSLFGLYQHIRPAGRIWLPGIAHGALGSAGYAALLMAILSAAVPDPDHLRPAFMLALGSALLAGSAMLVLRLRRKPISPRLIGIHAILAGAGLVLLIAYL